MGTRLEIGGTWSRGNITATAGTKIVCGIPPKPGYRTVINYLRYISAGTAHTLTILRPIGRTTIASAAAAAQAVVNITADPGAVAQYLLRNANGTSRVAANALAGNDRVCYALGDGTYVFDIVSSISTLAVTMTANVPTGGAAAGNLLWNFGVEADTLPAEGDTHFALKPTVSVATTYANEDGVVGTFGENQPMLLISDNGTAAGSIECVHVIYVKSGQ